ATETPATENGAAAATPTIQDRINSGFEGIVKILAGLLFYEVPLGFGGHSAPFILLVLIFGGIFFTLRFGFINLRLFRHSIDVIRGKYDRPEDEGEITHFQALTSALSATVGLGNIGGVAIAIAMGGPGAIFWMWVIAFFGMSAKFTSCSFAQLYRRVKPDGSVLGGPMVYLDEGIKERYPNLAWLGKTLGILFALFTIMASFGGGNMFQGNQTFKILSTEFGVPRDYAWVFGIVVAALVAVVIIGGIKRIGDVTSKMVPAMCAFFCICCLLIILKNIAQVPAMLTSIFVSAFQPDAVFSGGMIGVLLMGAKRAAFSNEAGLGSAAIAHAAARTDEPVREGVVAMIGPFIDTILVCTMTALT
ncbi:MAG TPA: alanine glycine permease, partial [Planctomycetaceae bacterium]|nr:alanine glycine permease [Planctomycetaceae bacterium]